MSQLHKSLLVTASLILFIVIPAVQAQGWAINQKDWIFGSGSTPMPTAIPSSTPTVTSSPTPTETTQPTATNSASPTPTAQVTNQPSMTPTTDTSGTPNPEATPTTTTSVPEINIIILALSIAAIAFGFLIAKYHKDEQP